MTTTLPPNWTNWTDERKLALKKALEREVELRRTLWNCGIPGCDGKPHTGSPAKHARSNQLPPVGDWAGWLIMAGRGYGKTRSGAEFIRQRVIDKTARRIALIGRTSADVRDTMIEGESGLLSVFPRWQRPRYLPTKRRVVFHNGAVAFCYSSDEPNNLRGPQHDTTWADEVSTYYHLKLVMSNMWMGLRLGDDPRAVLTGTPIPTKQFKELLAHPRLVIVTGTTYENLHNLAKQFRENVVEVYEGTRTGQQELMAVVLDDVPGALWSWEMFHRVERETVPEMELVVIAADPAVTSNPDSDLSGYAVVGRGVDQAGYVLESGGVRLTPNGFAQLLVAKAQEYSADYVIAEVNNGGDYIEALLVTVDDSIPYDSVRASHGKTTRAAPVVALYEKKRVNHVGPATAHAVLETQQTTWTGVYNPEIGSADVMDAVVWGLTYVMLAELPDQVIPPEWIDLAVQRWQQWQSAIEEPPGGRIVGISAGNMVAVRQGPRVYSVGPQRHLVFGVPVVVEGDVNRVKSPCDVTPWVATAPTTYRAEKDDYTFKDEHAAAWWRLREMLDPELEWQLQLPPDNTLRAELLSARWATKNNKVVVFVATRQYELAKALLLAISVEGGFSMESELLGGYY